MEPSAVTKYSWARVGKLLLWLLTLAVVWSLVDLWFYYRIVLTTPQIPPPGPVLP